MGVSGVGTGPKFLISVSRVVIAIGPKLLSQSLYGLYFRLFA